MSEKKIFVTQPSMPPLDEFVPYLEKIWSNKILTNKGPFHEELEQRLCDYLGVEYLSLFSNGTIALITALQALKISGEVITTPYSFVATAHSLLWNSIKPVFVDIDAKTLNINPKAIEAAVTAETTAIMPVHCYGHPCDVSAIQEVANKYNLKIIYDAAHAFGVEDDSGSILRHGDLSILSFHATKVFNTFEGGAVICPDKKTKTRIDQLKNFGFVDEVTVVEAGINGKMSEVNASFGLLQLEYIDKSIAARKDADNTYRLLLSGIKGVTCVEESFERVANYSYFPILIESDYSMSRDNLYERLIENNIYARRYFYPLISSFPMYRDFPSAKFENIPVANEAAGKVICLPIYSSLEISEQERIVAIIKQCA